MYLITPTLLNSFRYYFDCEPESSGEGEDFVSAEEKEKSVRADFLRTLSREKSEPTESMQKGIDFENAVRACCESPTGEEPEPVKDIARLCQGGRWQETVKKEFGEYLLYGKVDVVKRDTLIDVKFTSSYELGKFLQSMQHRIYFYCTGLPNFIYGISNGRETWQEAYYNHAGIEEEIRFAIREFIGYLDGDSEAKGLFYSKWVSYER